MLARHDERIIGGKKGSTYQEAPRGGVQSSFKPGGE
jgi:hypothetical protein